MTTPCHWVPNKNITVKTMHRSTVFGDCFRDPVIVVRRPHLVGIAVLQRPADPVDEDRALLLEDLRLPLLPRQVGVSFQNLLRVQERQLVGQVRILVGLQLGEELLGVLSAINSRDKPCFDKDDLAILESFADLAAVAIIRSRLRSTRAVVRPLCRSLVPHWTIAK